MSDKVHSTTDYHIFKAMPFNRGKTGLNREHLRKLEKSILERNLLHVRPIIVNKNMEIIDGHHRLEIAKKHKLTIYYVIQEDATYKDSITLTNGTSDWSHKAYVECRAGNGELEYVKLNNFLNETRINIHNLFRLASQTAHTSYWIVRIKDGTYKFNEKLNILKPYIEQIHEIMELLKAIGYKAHQIDKTYFWYGTYTFLRQPEVEWEKFKKALTKKIHILSEGLQSWQSVVTHLIAIHNGYARQSIKLVDVINQVKSKQKNDLIT